jgi:hypothetical protein
MTSFGRENVATDIEFLGELRAAADILMSLHQQRGDAAYLLRYEDLILKPQDTLFELFNFLDVDASAATVDSVLGRASMETDAMAGHRTTKNGHQSVGRWRQDLDPEMQEVCVEIFDDVLVEFGYEATAS